MASPFQHPPQATMDLFQEQEPKKSASRARRIPDNEWELHRSTIEELYMRNKKSVVIDKLRGMGFEIT